MALRLIEMILPQESGDEAQQLLSEQEVESVWDETISGSRVLLRILVVAEKNEPLIDRLEKQFSGSQEFRLILLPVTGSLPRVEEPEKNEGSLPRLGLIQTRPTEDLADFIQRPACADLVPLGSVV
jgi:hypothetical protein